MTVKFERNFEFSFLSVRLKTQHHGLDLEYAPKGSCIEGVVPTQQFSEVQLLKSVWIMRALISSVD